MRSSTDAELEWDQATAWHATAGSRVLEILQTGEDGLSEQQVAERAERFGPNKLEDQPPTPALVVLLRQFRSPLIYILLAAAVVTLLLEEYIDAAVIGAVLVLNAAIGFTQESKAEGSVRALMQLVVPQARVLRQGRDLEVDSPHLVPGDIVLLESGDRIPADIRLLSAQRLQVDESLLTGESVPPAKEVTAVREKASLGDRTCMAYTGTVVTSGRGRGVVVAIADRTELGSIAGLIRSETITRTPLQERMDRFAKVVGLAVGLGALVAFASGLALGQSVDTMFLTAVALAVAAIPEGLPAVFTITLALGVRRMARRNAVIRHLSAVETLGSTTVIASDKTGTLTANRMTVQKVWTPGKAFSLPIPGNGEPGESLPVQDHPNLAMVLLTGTLANEAQIEVGDDGPRMSGDPTESALFLSAITAGIDPAQERRDRLSVAEIPFEPEQRYSASLREKDGTQTLYVKGAPERIAEMCTQQGTDGETQPFDSGVMLKGAHEMAGKGLRILAFASRELSEPLSEGQELGEPRDLIFRGLQGMMDPPREGVAGAVQTCQRAGVRVVMITGDHSVTAKAIAQSLGIGRDEPEVLTGTELDALSDEELSERAPQIAVYARASPGQKLRIVRALKDLDNVVAVTGDGVNDAPALKAADIGVAMGRSGTDVAREAADMVLTDDNFVSIAAAVEEGRVTFDNLRKATFFLVSAGAATIIAILVGVWAQWPLIMLPAQLLWLNLVTNGLQDVALAFEPGEKGTLDRPPRPRTEGVLSRLLWSRTALAGLVMAAGTLWLFRWELERTGSLPRAQTVALTTMVVYLAFHAGNSRSEQTSVLRLNPFSNPFLLAATFGTLALHAGALYWGPTQLVLRVEPIGLEAWLRIVAVASTVLIAIEADKFLRRFSEARHNTQVRSQR